MEKLLSFPNVSTIAYYSPVSQTMNFSNLSHRHLDELIKQLENDSFDFTTVNSASLIIHEASHYYDNLATLSGQIMLAKTYDALNELESGTENDSILEYLNLMRSWKHDHYTRLNKKNISDPDYRDWTFYPNSGFSIDVFEEVQSEMFMYSDFKYQGNHVANVPFSIEALWETNAIKSELMHHIYTIEKIEEQEMRTVERHLLQQKYTQSLYHSEQLVYSHAAHLISAFLEVGDFIRSYTLSSALATISLNLPHKYYEQIKMPKGFLFRGITENLMKYNSRLDPCTIFLALLENLYESKEDVLKSLNVVDIDKVLAINGLPKKDVLNEEILNEMAGLDVKLKDGPFSAQYKIQKNNGIEIFKIDGLGLEGNVNVNPSWLIGLAKKTDSCIFEGDFDGENLLESPAIERELNFGVREKRMIERINELKKNIFLCRILNKRHCKLLN